MDAKLKFKIKLFFRDLIPTMKEFFKRSAKGICLLMLLVLLIVNSKNEFIQVRNWALGAFYQSEYNTQQLGTQGDKIQSTEDRIARLEAALNATRADLDALKQQQAENDVVKKPKKPVPPKSYPKPPADYVFKGDQPKPKKNWLQRLFS